MKTDVKLRPTVYITPELKKYLNEDEFIYEASSILREALMRALVSLDEVDISNIPCDEFTEKVLFRTDYDTYLLWRTLRRSERRKLYYLINKIALSIVEERLELKRKIKEKIKEKLTKISEYGTKGEADAAPETTNAAPETTDAASHRHQHREVIDAAPDY